MQQTAAEYPAVGTPFGHSLGLDPSLVVYDAGRSECTLTVIPSHAQVNHRGTVNGGFLQAVFDEVAAMLVARAFSPGAAVTNQATVSFRQSARPNQPLRFEVRITRRSPIRLWIDGEALSGQKKIATLQSVWLRRDTRARP